MAVWTIKGGSAGEYEDTFLERGVVSIGFDLSRSVSDFADREALRAHLGSRSGADQLWRFYQDVKDGDMVALPRKRTREVAVGRINGPYTYRTESAHLGAPHVRAVEWQVTNIPRSHFDRDLLNSFGSLLTISQPAAANAEARIARIVNAYLDTDQVGGISATPITVAEPSGDDGAQAAEPFEEIGQTDGGHKENDRLLIDQMFQNDFLDDHSEHDHHRDGEGDGENGRQVPAKMVNIGAKNGIDQMGEWDLTGLQANQGQGGKEGHHPLRVIEDAGCLEDKDKA